MIDLALLDDVSRKDPQPFIAWQKDQRPLASQRAKGAVSFENCRDSITSNSNVLQ
jgi:hypothetical protein